MKNVLRKYRYTFNYDESKPDCNFQPEIFEVVTHKLYDFEDYCTDFSNEGSTVDIENNVYFVVEYAERTGQAYLLLSTEETTLEISF